ncbi:Zn(2)-C6 fungal-type transcription factor [Pseudohyphozyma bogoriensis]|nr:Zn(2)-C6 fungal-type transcription factor [Pseudohyphozyma bogoriensis]
MAPDKQPAASTSKGAAPYKKDRKPPACDACKFRRVLCHPVPAPGSCPRCIDKGVVCTTTPVVRKKPAPRSGKRIEAAKVIFGNADGGTPAPGARDDAQVTPNDNNSPATHHTASPEGTPAAEVPSPPEHIDPSQITQVNGASDGQLSISQRDQDSLLAMSEQSGALAAILIATFQGQPGAFFPLPLLAGSQLSDIFEAVGRRLDCLPPHIEVLASVVIAFSARFSSHQLVLGPGTLPPSEPLFTLPIDITKPLDFRDYGRRRESLCQSLQDHAIKLMWERGATVLGGEENAASCHLMDVMETRQGIVSNRSYASAFVSHIRAIADDVDEKGESKLSATSIHWTPFVMQEALVAQNAFKASLFTKADQLNLCGNVNPVERVVLESSAGMDIRDVFMLLFTPMQSLTQGIADLAREASESFTGTYARSQPLDEVRLARWLGSFEQLRNLLTILMERAADQLSPQACAAHAYPPPQEAERVFVLRSCRYTMPIALSSLVLPVYRVVSTRIRIVDPLDPRKVGGGGMLFNRLRRAVTAAAKTVAECLRRDVPSLGFITHLQYFNVEDWAEVVAELEVGSMGDHNYSYTDKLTDLSTMIAALKRAAFAWPQHSDLIDSLDSKLRALQLEQALNSSDPTMLDPSTLRSRSQTFSSTSIPPQRFSTNSYPHDQQVPPPYDTESKPTSHLSTEESSTPFGNDDLLGMGISGASILELPDGGAFGSGEWNGSSGYPWEQQLYDGSGENWMK